MRFDHCWAVLCKWMNRAVTPQDPGSVYFLIYHFLNKMQFVFICIPFALFVYHQVFSSSGAKQNAGGGRHRQINSLQLMRHSDMEKIDAAPQHRLQLNLEKCLKFLMNKTNNSLCWWLLSLICCWARGLRWGETPLWSTLRFCRT